MLDKAHAIAPEIIRLRREIHAHPELAFQEVRTAQLVAETLREIGGIDIRTGVGKTGVVGQLGTGDGPTIGIRADMDALPIDEATGLPFASQHTGVMHACGHDAHTAILLGVAHLLKQEFAAGNLRGNVRFLFQPAEEAQDDEGLSGAPRMINDGALDDVDHVIALHVDSALPVGKITIRGGTSSAAVDSFRGWITASGGHGAYPHLGTDPLWMLLPVMQALHGIVARRIDPIQPAVVSLGVVRGGTVSNVIPAEVYLEGTLRSFDPGVREQLIAEVERAFAVARAVGGDYRLEIERGYPAGRNDPAVSDWIAETITDLIGADAIDRTRTGMGAEDFAYMTQKAPGAMFMLGAAIDDGVSRGHHTPIFDIDERALPIGAAILAETARRYLAREA
ncbi:M20 metallopeptidase family protein [Roseiflexus sp.]|uniref:M20 metallopeptidase family protein n=1 Tax=Roseiflexus sp. TaxID=2562120 RepID=UPI00398B3C8B